MIAKQIFIFLMSTLLLCPIIFAQETGTITDIDGNAYKTVKIGEQWWMAENLKTTQYRNGDAIPTGLSNSQWQGTISGSYAIYPHSDVEGINSDEEMVEAYGKLYNWYAVDDNRGLCPEGWRVPSDGDWSALVDYVVAQGYPDSNIVGGAGNALKSRRQVNSPLGAPWATSEHPRWNFYSTHQGLDVFGFSGLPGGYRSSNGNYYSVGIYGHWWSSRQTSNRHAWLRSLYFINGNVYRYGDDKRLGRSVRCMKDDGEHGNEAKLKIREVKLLSIDNNRNDIPFTNGMESKIIADVENVGNEIFRGDLFFRVEFIDIIGVGNDSRKAGHEHIVEVLSFSKGPSLRNLTNENLYDKQILNDSRLPITMQIPDQLISIFKPMEIYNGLFADKVKVSIYEHRDNDLIYHDTFEYSHQDGFTVQPNNEFLHNFNSIALLGGLYTDAFAGSGILQIYGSYETLRSIYTYARKWKIAKIEGDEFMARAYYRTVIGIVSYELFMEGIKIGVTTYKDVNKILVQLLSDHFEVLSNVNSFNANMTYFGYMAISAWDFFKDVFSGNTNNILTGINMILVKDKTSAVSKSTYSGHSNNSSISYHDLVFLYTDDITQKDFTVTNLSGNSIDIFASFSNANGTNDILDYFNIPVSESSIIILDYSDLSNAYELKVDYNGNGNIDNTYSPNNISNIDITPPHPVRDIIIQLVENVLNITWDENDDDVLKYVVYRNTTAEPPLSIADSLATVIHTSYADYDIIENTEYYYWITAVDSNYNESLKTQAVFNDFTTSVELVMNIPASYILFSNYPNPFNPSTYIKFSLPERMNINLDIYNILGQRITRLYEGKLEPGTHEITFDASHLPSGVYIYRLQAGEFVESRKMLLLK
jgi:uncharacterized protein (TIGR02145 family)